MNIVSILWLFLTYLKAGHKLFVNMFLSYSKKQKATHRWRWKIVEMSLHKQTLQALRKLLLSSIRFPFIS